MTTQVTPTQSGLDRLPLEIIILIIRNAVGEAVENRGRYFYKHSYRLLKNLRLTHERFANLSCINKILFTSIQLEPTRACLTSIQRGDFSRVANYVHSIVFITPPSWALLFDTFKELVTVDALRTLAEPFADKYQPYFPTSHFDSSLQDTFVNQHLGGKWPFTETQLADGYAAYMRDAKATHALLEETGEPKTAWVEILRQLGSRLGKIKFITRDCEDLRSMEYFDTPKTEAPCQISSHHHFNLENDYGCRYATAIAGDRLFATVMSCIALSGVSIRQISIAQTMAGNLNCSKITGWEKLDLTSLDKLKFNPYIVSDDYRRVHESVFNALPCQSKKQIERKVSSILDALIQKCHTSLQHVQLAGWGPITWPRQPAIDMPALRHFRYSFGNLQPLLFRDWMARMPHLRHLNLSLRLSEEFGYTDWVYVFDAIRDHPNVAGSDSKGLFVRFDQIITCDWTEMSWGGVVCRDSNIATERRTDDPSMDGIEDSALALEKHFYGDVPFRKNYALRYWLDDWDPDMGHDASESESGSDDDEDYDSEDDDDEDEDGDKVEEADDNKQ